MRPVGSWTPSSEPHAASFDCCEAIEDRGNLSLLGGVARWGGNVHGFGRLELVCAGLVGQPGSAVVAHLVDDREKGVALWRE